MSSLVRGAGRLAGKVAYALLLAAALVVGGTLMAAHTYSLPHPEASDPGLAAAMRPFASSRWTLVHALYGRCRCSARIIGELTSGPRPPDVAEIVVAVDPGPDWAERLGRRGIRLVTTDAIALKRDFAIEAAPLLVVLAPNGAVAYSGGYTSHQQGPEIEDVQIVNALRGRTVPVTLPVFGCATARELASAIDPLGIK